MLDIVEPMAEFAHNLWSKWYKHQRDNNTPENIKRWNAQSETAYCDLSEEDKNKDKKEIIRICNILETIAKNQIKPVLIQLVRSDPGNYGWLENNYPEMYELIKDE